MSSPLRVEEPSLAMSASPPEQYPESPSGEEERRVNEYAEFLCAKNDLGVMQVAVERASFLQKAHRDEITREETLGHIKAETILLLECEDDKEESDDDDMSKIELLAVMSNRINMIYHHLFRLFPVDIYWLKEYMNFFMNYESLLSADNNLISSLMTKNHPNPEVYIKAALFEFEIRSNIDTARKYFFHGKQFHSDQSLYIEDFCFEVKILQKSNGASLSKALELYRSSIQCFKGDLQFHIQLLDNALHLTTVPKLQYHIVKDMVAEYKSESRMWEKLAKVNFDGFIFDGEKKTIVHDKHFKRRLINSCNAFEEGLRENERDPLIQKNLWCCYTDHMIEVWKSVGVTNETIEVFLNAKMKWVFENSRLKDALKDEHYVYWAEYTNQDNADILQKAIELNNGVHIWSDILDHFLQNNIYDMAFKVLKDSMEALKKESLPLWMQFDESLELKKERDRLQKLFSEGINCEFEEICTEMKISYLSYTHRHNSVSVTRKVFKDLKELEPRCKDLYLQMIEYEKGLNPNNEVFISKLYIEMCERFGHIEIELWIQCLEHNYSIKNYAQAKEAFYKASSILSPGMMIVLQNEFEKIKTKCRNDNDSANQNVVAHEDI